MNKSETLNKFAPAFLKAQKMITGAVKDSTNPHFRSKYADYDSVVEAVKNPLNDNDIGYLHLILPDGSLETVLLHESGEWISSTSPIKVVPEYLKKEVITEEGKILKDSKGGVLKEIIPGTAYETP